MNISKITTVSELEKLINATEKINLSVKSKKEKYEFMGALLVRVKYYKLTKKEKGIVKKFIIKCTEYSQRQLKRIIRKYKEGRLVWSEWQKPSFCQIYTKEDIALLHKVDQAHGLSGKGIKAILKREYEVFHKLEFERISKICVSHIYNLRGSVTYARLGKVFEKTKKTTVPIGIRTKPTPHGRPGHFRVDTVHQGDKEGKKGVYYINIVDEVTQFEFVFCVPRITFFYIEEVLKVLLILCPFTIVNFHSDNGSEYINKEVANFLNQAHIRQTKSRSRKTNDNALVESKNGSIIRRHFGYAHIPATPQNARIISTFCREWLNPYVNYHRPSGFATTKADAKGKERKIYQTNDYETPYEKLKSLPKADQYLKKDISFEQLDKIAYKQSDTDFVLLMNKAKEIMFSKLAL